MLNSLWLGDRVFEIVRRVNIQGMNKEAFQVEVPFTNGRLYYPLSSFFDSKVFSYDEGEGVLNKSCIESTEIMKKWSSLEFGC